MNQKTLTEQLREEAASLEKLEALDERYPGLPGVPYVFNCTLNIDLRGATASTRDKVLGTVGDILGRNGWTKKAGYDGAFRYRREVDGVTVLIQGAERFHEALGEIPVPPSAFPLLLEDVPSTETAAFRATL